MTVQSPTLDELVQSMYEQAELLKKASEIEANGEADIRDEVVRQQMRRAAELVEGAAVLGAKENAVCLGIIARALLENLISSLWMVRSKQNAEAHQNAAKSELAKAFKINLKSGKAKVHNRHTGADESASFLESEQMNFIPKRKSVEAQAKEAEISDLYDIFYRFLSLETHGHHSNSEQLGSSKELVIIHLQGFGALSRGIGQAGVWWLMHRHWPDNESLRSVLGLNGDPNK
jgi:hypothetical protein